MPPAIPEALLMKMSKAMMQAKNLFRLVNFWGARIIRISSEKVKKVKKTDQVSASSEINLGNGLNK